jgi:two-component system sensor histidine kinase UhpB
VHVEHGEATLTVRVTDDGAARPQQRPHRSPTAHGIRGMRERAMLIGAGLSIAARVGGGTQVQLTIPHLSTRTP